MGGNLALNIERRGFTVAVYNHAGSKADAFVNGRAAGKNIARCHDLADLAASLSKPRKVLIMMNAGKAVDETVGQLLEFLEKGDIIIDGANSNYKDTIRRTAEVESKGLLYIGAGIDGGEEGALAGASIMLGGSVAAWPVVKPLFQAIAATVETAGGRMPCCDWVGENGAGHFVKMVHNGIEYGDMQLICETYDIMKNLLGLSCEEIAGTYDEWNRGELNSYLLEITSGIMRYKDTDGSPLVEKILDTAGQKGTGKWAGISALELEAPLTVIGEAVFMRYLSAARSERMRASRIFSGPRPVFAGDKQAFLSDLREALCAAKSVSYAQSFFLMRTAAKEYKWNLNPGSIAFLWKDGCVIRAALLGKAKEAFDKKPDLENLLLDPAFTRIIENAQASWRRVVAAAVTNGIPAPAFSSSLAYFDAFRREQLPANLIQAQRDYFGGHTYERLDKNRGDLFRTDWTGNGIARQIRTFGSD